MLTPLRYARGCLTLIDQRRLPAEEIWVDYTDLEAVAVSIEEMVVRGAPAIGCTAAFGLVLDAAQSGDETWGAYRKRFESACDRLARTRPTAVNLFFAIDAVKACAAGFANNEPMANVAQRIERCAQALFEDDLATCKSIGDHGAAMSKPGQRLRVLTHCNAGALATAGYGTALGVIRSLAAMGRLEEVFVDETRPWWQGARLTAFEMRYEKIKHTLIADSVAAVLMQKGLVDWVVVGADRIAANGDTANKVGTYSLAVAAAHHGVKFFIAAPRSTFDLSILNGSQIPIELRAQTEVTHFKGQPIAPLGTEAYNPSFDVTPAKLISGFITERGVVQPPF